MRGIQVCREGRERGRVVERNRWGGKGRRKWKRSRRKAGGKSRQAKKGRGGRGGSVKGRRVKEG